MKEQRDRARADARAKRPARSTSWPTGGCSPSTGPPTGAPTTTLRTDSRVLGVVADGETVAARSRAGRASAASSSTGRRSTPSPAARSPTPASSPGTAAAPRSSTSSGRSRAWSPTRCGCSRASCATGAELTAEVDYEWRLSACQAHSGTHVVHAALRQVLGPQALQSGSYNRPGYLRLDFAWQGALARSSAATSRTSPTPPSAPTTGVRART